MLITKLFIRKRLVSWADLQDCIVDCCSNFLSFLLTCGTRHELGVQIVVGSHGGCRWVYLPSSYWKVAKEIFKRNEATIKEANKETLIATKLSYIIIISIQWETGFINVVWLWIFRTKVLKNLLVYSSIKKKTSKSNTFAFVWSNAVVAATDHLTCSWDLCIEWQSFSF